MQKVSTELKVKLSLSDT